MPDQTVCKAECVMSDTDAVDSDGSRADSVITRKDLSASQRRQNKRIRGQIELVSGRVNKLEMLLLNAQAYCSWDDIYHVHVRDDDDDDDDDDDSATRSAGPFPDKVLKFWHLQRDPARLAEWLRIYSIDDWVHWHLDPNEPVYDSDGDGDGYNTLEDAVRARPLIALGRMANRLGLDMSRITELMKSWEQAQLRNVLLSNRAKTRKREEPQSTKQGSSEQHSGKRQHKRPITVLLSPKRQSPLKSTTDVVPETVLASLHKAAPNVMLQTASIQIQKTPSDNAQEDIFERWEEQGHGTSYDYISETVVDKDGPLATSPRHSFVLPVQSGTTVPNTVSIQASPLDRPTPPALSANSIALLDVQTPDTLSTLALAGYPPRASSSRKSAFKGLTKSSSVT